MFSFARVCIKIEFLAKIQNSDACIVRKKNKLIDVDMSSEGKVKINILQLRFKSHHQQKVEKMKILQFLVFGPVFVLLVCMKKKMNKNFNKFKMKNLFKIFQIQSVGVCASPQTHVIIDRLIYS